MPAPDDGTEPVADEEIIYRRVPVSKTDWYCRGDLSPEAFDPLKDEHTGISVSRAKHTSIEQAAQGRSKSGYYVAVYRVADLRAHGIDVVPRPLPGNPGHAELPDINSGNRLEDATLEKKNWLAELKL